MHEWYVVQVIPGQEKRVKKNLEETRESQGMVDFVADILIPTENVAEVKGGEQKVSEKRVWPGYILVNMTLRDESWLFIKGCNGVVDFLGGKPPLPLTKSEIDAILSDLETKKLEVTHKHNIKIGDKVKINHGVFSNCMGTVHEVFHDKGRLNVFVSIFGRDTCVNNLEFWEVEQILQESDNSK
jgi:transcription termination/antitermination protein NusG